MRNCCLYCHCNPSVLHRPFSKLFHVLVQKSLVNYIIFFTIIIIINNQFNTAQQEMQECLPKFLHQHLGSEVSSFSRFIQTSSSEDKSQFCPESFLFLAILFCEPNCHSYFISQFFVYSKLLEEMTAENTRLTEILKVKEETERKQAGSACLLSHFSPLQTALTITLP